MLGLYSWSVPAHGCEGCARRLPRELLERFRAAHSVFLRARRATLAVGNTLASVVLEIVRCTTRVVVPRQRNSSRASRETLPRLPRRRGSHPEQYWLPLPY